MDPLTRARRTPTGLAQLHDPTYRLWRWIALVQRYLLEIAAGRLRRLMVFVPPQSGKSELISHYFPAWYLGNFPDRKVILASYNDTWARHWGMESRQVLEEHGRSVFNVAPSEAGHAADFWKLGGHRGYMATAGVGGGLTGRGAHVLVIDDPHKDVAEATSKLQQEKSWNWYQAVTRTRLQPGGAQIVLQTRWHDMDLSGRILKRAAQSGEVWKVISLPAIADRDELEGTDLPVPFIWRRQAGQALEPQRFDLAHYRELEAALDPRWFQALYQQRPRAESGEVFQRPWFRYYTTTGSEHGLTIVLDRIDAEGRILSTKRVNWGALRRFLTVDLALSQKTTADWTVIAAWGQVRSTKDLVLLDLWRARIEAPDVLPALRAMTQRQRPERIHVESVAYQMSIVQAGRRAGLPVVEYQPIGDKLSRANYAAARMEGGSVWFPARAEWLATYEGELLAYDRGEHDDQVDVTSMAVEAADADAAAGIIGYR